MALERDCVLYIYPAPVPLAYGPGPLDAFLNGSPMPFSFTAVDQTEVICQHSDKVDFVFYLHAKITKMQYTVQKLQIQIDQVYLNCLEA